MEISGVRMGQVLHGTYRIKSRLAMGGMGIVYLAEHVRLQQKQFAIKVLNPKVIQERNTYLRFRREAEIVSGLGHPNIVYVLDFNETEDGQPYIVMEYLEGMDLRKRLRETGKLAPEEVGALIQQTANALQKAHDRNIVHRDMKPGNIFLVDTPDDSVQVKLLDFGISKIRHHKNEVTQDQTIIGTPFYMAPEQAEGSIADIDHRTDIFSLGTIAYLALSNRLPFDAPTTPGVLFNVCYKEPRPITELEPGLPPEVHGVLCQAMAKSKLDRYQQVEDFSRELLQALACEVDEASFDEVSTDPLWAPAPTVVDLTEELRTGDVSISEELSTGDVSISEELSTGDVPIDLELPTGDVSIDLELPTKDVSILQELPTESMEVMEGEQPSQVTLRGAAGEQAFLPGNDPKPRRTLALMGGISVLLLAAGITAVILLGEQETQTAKQGASAPPQAGPGHHDALQARTLPVLKPPSAPPLQLDSRSAAGSRTKPDSGTNRAAPPQRMETTPPRERRRPSRTAAPRVRRPPRRTRPAAETKPRQKPRKRPQPKPKQKVFIYDDI